MHEIQPQKEYGPALAIMVITAIVMAAAVVLYGQLTAIAERDTSPIGASRSIDSSLTDREIKTLEIDQSLEQIEQDLAELQQFEEEYLDFSDLDELELDFNF